MGRTLRRPRHHYPLSLSEQGDTIVEVMISLIVIASIITGAFLVSRTSSHNIRSSQEHSEALQLLQGQVELLRSKVTSAPAGTPWMAPPGNFCIAADGTATPTSSNACDFTQSGHDYAYSVVISKDTSVSSSQATGNGFGDTYDFNVTWPSISGGNNNESLVYRVPKV